MVERKGAGFRAVVIAASAGGLNALREVLGGLPPAYPLPILVVQHLGPSAGSDFADLLNELCPPQVKEAEEGELARPGVVYVAPANYHLLVEKDGRLALSTDPAVNYARPSADVLFESAADAFKAGLIGIVLTGANNDGSAGLKRVKEQGGFTVVQDPNEAEFDAMPCSALEAAAPDRVLPLGRIAAFLREVSDSSGQPSLRRADRGRR